MILKDLLGDVSYVNASSVKRPGSVVPRRLGLSTANEASQLYLNLVMSTKKADIGQMLKEFICHSKEPC